LSESKPKRRVGIFFLAPPDKKYPTYRICWVEKVGQHRQTRRLSTGERTDEEAAWRQLQIHALKNSEKQTAKPTDQPVAQVLAWHWLNYGKNLASWETVELAKNAALACWGTAMVSDLDATRQLQFIKSLRDRGVADVTIHRWMTVIWTAMNTAASCNQLAAEAIPKRIRRRLWGERTQPVRKRSAKASKRALELKEWAKLFDAAAGRPYRLRFLILQMGTGGRTGAVARLSRPQVDFDHGIIDMNPPGRQQSKKYHPKIPASEVLLRHLKLWGDEAQHNGRYIYRFHHPVSTFNFIRKTIKEAGVPDCTPYTLRHSVASWLADCEASFGVGRRERKMFLGHLRPDGGSTDDYTHYNPKYLRNAARAIDALFEAVAPLTKVDLLLREYEEQPVPESAWIGADGLLEAMHRNETRVIAGNDRMRVVAFSEKSGGP
jgi:integrase